MAQATGRQLHYIKKLIAEIKKQGGEVFDYIEEFLLSDKGTSMEASSIIEDMEEQLGWRE